MVRSDGPECGPAEDRVPVTTAQMGRTGSGVAFIVSAGVVYEIIAAACSSPQTTEINAASRADTLMKWVHLGIVQSAVFIAIGAYFEPQHRVEIITGGGLAVAVLYGSYIHAKACGLKNGGATTEPSTKASFNFVKG